jgi:phosphoserine phosphatase
MGLMSHVLVVVSNPLRPAVDERLTARLSPYLYEPGPVRVLSPGIAAEIPFRARAGFSRAEMTEITRDLRPVLEGAPVDLAVVSLAHRRKQLFLADMDSTMIAQECIDELAAELGLKPRIAAITERAMRGEIAFEPALRERVALLRGLPVETVDQVIAQRITLVPGGPALLKTLRANGAYTALVSGGFTLFTGPISATLGFHEHRSNRLGVEDGKLDGTVGEPILGQEAKKATLIELRTRLSVHPDAVMAVGDGANDLAMLGEAGLGVAAHAKPAVAEAADVRIDHSDLTALLYLQGYADKDIVST